MFPTRINVGQLLLTFGRYVAIGAVEGLPEKHTPVNKYIRDGVEPEDMVLSSKVLKSAGANSG